MGINITSRTLFRRWRRPTAVGATLVMLITVAAALEAWAPEAAEIISFVLTVAAVTKPLAKAALPRGTEHNDRHSPN